MIPDYADMELRQEARETARILLQTGAIRYDARMPFRLDSGLASPMHVDVRQAMGDVAARRRLVDLAVEMLERDADPRQIDAVACCTQGQGVPIATQIAERLHKPMIFVRHCDTQDPHKHEVEGAVRPGTRVLLVEQLLADGERKARMVKRLQQAGANVTDLFVVFQYGVFDRIHEVLAPLGVRIHALTTWWDLLEAVDDHQALPAPAIAEIKAFLRDPGHWKAGG